MRLSPHSKSDSANLPPITGGRQPASLPHSSEVRRKPKTSPHRAISSLSAHLGRHAPGTFSMNATFRREPTITKGRQTELPRRRDGEAERMSDSPTNHATTDRRVDLPPNWGVGRRVDQARAAAARWPQNLWTGRLPHRPARVLAPTSLAPLGNVSYRVSPGSGPVEATPGRRTPESSAFDRGRPEIPGRLPARVTGTLAALKSSAGVLARVAAQVVWAHKNNRAVSRCERQGCPADREAGKE
jgi:hypothetical protein